MKVDIESLLVGVRTAPPRLGGAGKSAPPGAVKTLPGDGKETVGQRGLVVVARAVAARVVVATAPTRAARSRSPTSRSSRRRRRPSPGRSSRRRPRPPSAGRSRGRACSRASCTSPEGRRPRRRRRRWSAASRVVSAGLRVVVGGAARSSRAADDGRHRREGARRGDVDAERQPDGQREAREGQEEDACSAHGLDASKAFLQEWLGAGEESVAGAGKLARTRVPGPVQQLDRAVPALGELGDDREPEPGAGARAPPLRAAVEALEDVRRAPPRGCPGPVSETTKPGRPPFGSSSTAIREPRGE